MPSRRTKVYRDRSEYELDVQVMRAEGWVVEHEYDDGVASSAAPGGCLLGGSRYTNDDVTAYRPGTVDDWLHSKRIQVTYRRAD